MYKSLEGFSLDQLKDLLSALSEVMTIRLKEDNPKVFKSLEKIHSDIYQEIISR